VGENAEALEALRRASRRPHADFDWDYLEPVPVLDGLDDVGQGVRLLCLAALVADRNGEQAQAVSDIATALRLVAFPDRDPILLVHLLRSSSASVVTRCCGTLLQSADVRTDLLEALQAPLRDAMRGLDLGRAMACERAWLIRMWEEIMSGDWALLDRNPPGRLATLLARPVLMSRMAAMLPAVSEAVSITGRPTWEAVERMRGFQSRIERACRAAEAPVTATLEVPHPISLLGSYERATEEYADCRALIDAMRIAIALRLFRADRGTPAPALEELVPRYLPQIPPDPYTGRSLLLTRGDGFITVYSVGSDLQDDGGSIDEDPERYDRPDIGVRIRE
jgi:hypothetical protein